MEISIYLLWWPHSVVGGKNGGEKALYKLNCKISYTPRFSYCKHEFDDYANQLNGNLQGLQKKKKELHELCESMLNQRQRDL